MVLPGFPEASQPISDPLVLHAKVFAGFNSGLETYRKTRILESRQISRCISWVAFPNFNPYFPPPSSPFCYF
jgi:hypothetical protein